MTQPAVEAPAETPPPEEARRRAPRRLFVRLVGGRYTPLIVLGLLSLFSLGARAVWLDDNNPHTQGLIFDEVYYVNAARTILGRPIPYPAIFAGAPKGKDPNIEHPPLAKLAIALGIKLFGDGPLGWRIASLVFGSAALLAMYCLVRSAGGSSWLAVGAAAIMVGDNLFLVHGGIATLDIFVLAFMLVGVALYLRGRSLLGGVAIGAAACTKTVGFYAVAVIVLFELLRLLRPSRSSDEDAGTRFPMLAGFLATTVAAYIAILYVLDRLFTTFADPIAHSSYMFDYNTHLGKTVAPGLFAPGSSPWQWLINRRPIVYYAQGSTGPGGAHPQVLFQGRMSPFIVYMTIPAFLLAVGAAWRRRDDVSFLIVAWCLGTFLPLVVISSHRESYIYYMLIVLPGIYLAIARLFSGGYLPKPKLAASLYGLALAYGFVAFYPLRG